MRKKTPFLALLLALTMLVSFSALADTAQPPPEEMESIPVREFFEDLGGIVVWSSEDRSISVAVDGGTVILFAGQTSAYTNDVAMSLQYGVNLQQGRAFIYESDIMLLLISFLETLLDEPDTENTITFYLTEEARDIVLYDFDYMIRAILENSPWDSVIYRALEFDFDEYVALFKDFIEAMEPVELVIYDEIMFNALVPSHDGDDARSIAANYLFAMLAFEFAPPLNSIGHLSPRTLDMYTALLSGFLRQYHDETFDSENNLLLALLLDTYLHPSAVWFYGEVEVDLEAGILDDLPNIPGNIVTEILVPDEVAFLRINTFWANPEYDDLVILPFLQEIQDFDHLILDLRGNLGGLAVYFDEFILRRLISEPVEISTREFFSGGDKANELMEVSVQTLLQMESVFDWSELLYAEILPASEFIAEHGMLQFNQDDLARLDYVMISRSAISPADDSINFDGKVWLLVDGMSMSASVLAAEVALETGFATVVGENTSGVMGSSHIYIALPNTGIIWRIDVGYRTDPLGNSLEVYGLAPQIRNIENMNALETVLSLIAEGEY